MKILKSNIMVLGLAAMSALTLGTACSEDFLDVESKTESSTQTFYRNENDAWRALMGCYAGWRHTSSRAGDASMSFYLASTIMSDEAYGASDNADGRSPQVLDRFDQTQSPADQNILLGIWKQYYAGVYRCNELITREDQIEWEPNSANRKLYIGEARALRGLLYFDMVRLWGHIPLFLEPSAENRAQADPAEVFAAIVDDLKFAAENIPADANLTEDANGRITRYAAKAMLARVYLFYTGYYGKEPGYTDASGKTTGTLTKAEALAGLQDVIGSRRYGLVDEFKNLWPGASLVALTGDKVGWDTDKSTYAGDANKEVILSMKFTPTSTWSGPYDGCVWLVMMGMRNLNFPPCGQGWGFATVCPSYMAKFENGDPRLKASVTDLIGEGVDTYPGNDFQGAVNDWREYTGYTIKKYCPLRYSQDKTGTNPSGTGDMQLDNVQPYVLMRYADVLLMAAELGAPEAQSYFDQVRARSGRPSVALTHESLMNERAVELAYESIRYWDLLRQGVDVMADAVVASGGHVKNGGRDGNVTFDRAKIVATRGLSQIPNDQITLSNGVLKQNDGWK